MNVNEKAIRDGIKKANMMIEQRIFAALYRLGMYYLQHAIDNKTYSNLTGNTITSTSFGLYKDYKLVDVVFISMEAAIRTKLIKGEWVSNFLDYDGNIRTSFMATIDTDAFYGKEFSMDFLYQFKPEYANSIVWTTGTEYSDALELEWNVLQETADEVYNTKETMFRLNFEKIK